jgi:hypothetical protein
MLRPIRSALLASASMVLPAQVQVELSPRNPVIQAAASLTFRARVLNAVQDGCRWSVAGPGGALSPTGVFIAPPGDYTVRATSLADAEAWDETRVLVLPDHAALRTVADLLGPGAFAPGWSEALPFGDIAGPGRFGDPRAVVEPLQGAGYAELQIVGYGLKVPVSWPRWGLRPDALLLSFLESGEPVRIEPGGMHFCEIQARGAVTLAQVEALNRGTPSSWMSRTQKLRIKVRGLVPLAGNPLTEPGHADGSWLSARFRRPAGLAMLDNGTLVAADPEAHVVRIVSPDREVTTLCGAAGEPGHRDGSQQHARFRGPTFVAPEVRENGGPWLAAPSFVLSDSGNHVIRAVDALGRVTTLAGAPGERGHRDSADARLARFDDPQGLAVDAGGTIYVADRGNHVIRKLPPEGGASTLAGMPGQAGSQDGRPTEARFRDLKGLAIGKPVDGALTCTLYVVDGHSVRRVSPAGDVTTLCGDPATPGTPGPGAGTPLDLAWVPCLDNPYGITVAWPRIIVTDRGNHAIQVLRPEYAGRVSLSTLVGDRSQTSTRFGLLRCGLQGPLGPEFGALGEPKGVAVDRWGDVYVADGPCLVQCSEPLATRMEHPALALRPGGAVAAGLDLAVAFTGPRARIEGEPGDPVPCFWTLDCIDPHTGRPGAARLQGQLRGQSRGCAIVSFEEKGEVEVRLLCTAHDGTSLTDTVAIRVD